MICCGRRWSWESVSVPVTDAHRAIVAPVARRVMERYATRTRSRFPTTIERVTAGLLAELIATDVLRGSWGHGDSARPDVALDGSAPVIHGSYPSAEIRWTGTRRPRLSYFAKSQDRGKLAIPYVLATGDDEIVLHGWALGREIDSLGQPRPEGWQEGRWLDASQLHGLPLHPVS